MKDIQTQRLYDYLDGPGRSIDPLAALKQLGISRLAARIHNLREEGVEIESQFRKVKNRFGETARVKEYWLV